jgi:cytosine/adenosine deaminase-related metal-dependent hydrolase
MGTDSLASVPDLNVFAEIAEMRRLAPAVPAARLLESATVNGAEALGFGSDFGTIERGKRNRLIAIDVGKSERDVAECLVSGVEADRVEWL